MFNKMKISTKFFLIGLATVILFSIVIVWIGFKYSSSMYDAKSLKTKQEVETAWSILDYYAKEVKSGALTVDEAKKRATQTVKSLRYGENDYFWINDTRPYMIMHPIKPEMNGTDISGQKDPNGKKFFVEMVEVAKKDGAGSVEYLWPKPGYEKPVPKISYVKMFPEWNWIIGSGIYLDDVQKETRSIFIMFASIIIVLIGVILALFYFAVNKIIVNPIKDMSSKIMEIGEGNLDIDIDIHTEDEIGAMAESCRTMVGNLSEIVSNINSSSRQVATGANQISMASQALSQGSTEQASSIEEITASMTQVAAQTKMNATNANQANELAVVAKENAVSGNGQMHGMLKAMDEINDSSESISKIIKVIDEIAFQTNILALNAAVEAARAGQHGKGFAVVAEEVRNLAARSANAAKETTAMIEGSIGKVEMGTKIANETAEALSRIVGDVTKAAEIVGGIASASNEQATAIAQVSVAIEQVSQVVQTNSATAQECAAASQELTGQAGMLKEVVSKFKLKKS